MDLQFSNDPERIAAARQILRPLVLARVQRSQALAPHEWEAFFAAHDPDVEPARTVQALTDALEQACWLAAALAYLATAERVGPDVERTEADAAARELLELYLDSDPAIGLEP